ncbi:MAG: hypothetical protein OEY63_03730, partial [Gemmatimonadota bacterium]|nr:hypothetical protein [Gemmatimonadota bacterium]
MNRLQPYRAKVLVSAAMFLMLLGACNFDVENPGPTADGFLDSLVAHQAVMVGARRDLAIAMQNITYWGAAMTYEINPAGSTGSYGIPSYIQAGRFDEFDSGDWNVTQRARWVAEDAYDRFARSLAAIEGAPALASYELAAWVRLYAGYANRLLGENFCQVTFNGGGVESHTAAFQRAEGYFTDAIAIATAAGNTSLATAARAGRASVRANLASYGLASWADAVADAGAVPNDFVFSIPYSTQQQSQFNFIHFANGNEPYRAHTIWGTFYEDYFTSTGDPRVSWEIGDCPDCPDPLNPTGDAAVDKFGGQVPWYPQTKFDQRDSPINLSSGWEMRLIEAAAA